MADLQIPFSFSVKLSSFVSLKEVILEVQVVEIIISDIQVTRKQKYRRFASLLIDVEDNVIAII